MTFQQRYTTHSEPCIEFRFSGIIFCGLNIPFAPYRLHRQQKHHQFRFCFCFEGKKILHEITVCVFSSFFWHSLMNVLYFLFILVAIFPTLSSSYRDDTHTHTRRKKTNDDTISYQNEIIFFHVQPTISSYTLNEKYIYFFLFLLFCSLCLCFTVTTNNTFPRQERYRCHKRRQRWKKLNNNRSSTQTHTLFKRQFFFSLRWCVFLFVYIIKYIFMTVPPPNITL